MSGVKDAVFWLRQIVHLALWWLTLEAVYHVAASWWTGAPVTAGAVLKIFAFALLAALLAWKWPPAVAQADPVWWARLAVSVYLWFAVLERFWSALAAARADDASRLAPVGSAVVFAMIVALVTWFVLPRHTPAAR